MRNVQIYRGTDDKLYIISRFGFVEATGLTFTSNEWHTVSLVFSKSSQPDSLNNYESYITLRVDNQVWSDRKINDYVYGNLKVSIGRKTVEERITSTSLGVYNECYPLYGQIEMLAMKSGSSSETTISTLMSELISATKTSLYDDLGLLRKTEVKQGDTTVVSNTYLYKSKPGNPNFTSHQVLTETIKVGSQTIQRTYNTDALGRVTNINDPIFGSHQYTYDYRGFLVNADGEQYTYDNNGNLSRKGSFSMLYSNSIKDKLISYGGNSITYSNMNQLNPIKYGNILYQYEGRRLTRYTRVGTQSDMSSVYYDYTYNELGQRIKKQSNEGDVWRYVYDGDRLVCEVGPNAKLDFLYDENGELFGFIKDNTDKYYYIKDCYNNILGITCNSGGIVVKYNYNAWGKVQSISGSMSSTIGKLNPFMYKGYYYDRESQMYYCHTRYYVPEWGRWLNADDPSYLDFKSASNINLYAYCGNNPIHGVDSSGAFALTAISVSVIALAALIFGTFIVTTVGETEKQTSVISSNLDDFLDSVKTAIAAFVSSLAANNNYNNDKELHHIVPQRARRGVVARYFLRISGIDINDSINLVSVKKGFHRVMHTNTYYAIVTAALAIGYSIDGPNGVEKA